MSEAGIGKPWRHHPAAGHPFHVSSVLVHLRVRDQRHGSDLARTMACLAMLLQNWQHVFIESRSGGMRRGRRVRADAGTDKRGEKRDPLFPIRHVKIDCIDAISDGPYDSHLKCDS